LFLLLLALLQPGAGLAAADTGADSPQSNSWSDVKMFAVAPVKRPIALLAPNAQTPVKPASLNQEQQLQILAALGGDGKEDSAPATPAETVPFGTFVLSAANTVHEDQGVLTLVQPYTVHPETGIHMRGSEPGSVGVKVRVEEGGRYLVDFLVRSAVPGNYQLDTEGETQTVEDALGEREHVLLALSAGSSGWTTVRLRRPDSDFFLYAVEITRFD
jgi:hypothetical protein